MTNEYVVSYDELICGELWQTNMGKLCSDDLLGVGVVVTLLGYHRLYKRSLLLGEGDTAPRRLESSRQNLDIQPPPRLRLDIFTDHLHRYLGDSSKYLQVVAETFFLGGGGESKGGGGAFLGDPFDL